MMPRRVEQSDHYRKGGLVFGRDVVCDRCGGTGIDTPMSSAEVRARRKHRGDDELPRWPCDKCGGSKTISLDA